MLSARSPFVFLVIIKFLLQHVLCQCPLNKENPAIAIGSSIGVEPTVAYCAIPPLRCLCDRNAYRSLDGSCNNLKSTGFGMAYSKYKRLMPSAYEDKIHEPKRSVCGKPLPNARILSLGIFGETDALDPNFTLLTMQWGQVLAHDISFAAGVTQTRKHPVSCCSGDNKVINSKFAHRTCFAIKISPYDPVFSRSKPPIECLEFVRTLTDKDINCVYARGAPAEQINSVTSYIDASIVYGNSLQQNLDLRLFKSGRLWTKNVGKQEFLPPSDNASAFCGGPDETCYKGGDVRLNQSPGLISLQTLLLREHNRIADGLTALNALWTDEKIFQEARKILIATYQHINYYEFLPILYGRENMFKQKLIYISKKGEYVNDYDSTIDPSAINSFSTAAYRLFHSAIEGQLKLLNESRYENDSLRLSDYFNMPGVIEIDDNLASIIRGHTTQPEECNDINIDREVKHFLSRGLNEFGSDLKARDIQRNRDHGLPSYNQFREFFGLQKARDWIEFSDLISPQFIQSLQLYYTNVDDVDLTVGAALEDNINESLVGPTFYAIAMEQFYASRVGDRFFYEHREAGFTKDQLNEIRKVTMARLICDNIHEIKRIQPEAFRIVSKNNEYKKCGDIPKLNLRLWEDNSD